MNPLQTLIIRDFQIHGKLTLPLSPTVTTLVGKSNAGKSSVVRALRFLALNKPNGDSFIKDGADRTAVTLIVGPDKIKRVKGKKVNTYSLNGTVLKAFGTEPPESISQVLKLGEINFQKQHDPAFWFANTPGEVSRQLNEIINLGEMDRVLAALSSRSREAGARVSVAKIRLAEAKKIRSSLLWVGEAGVEMANLTRIESEITQIRAKRMLIADLIEKGLRYTQTLKNAATLELYGNKAVEAGGKALEMGNRVIKLRDLILGGQIGGMAKEKAEREAAAAIVELQKVKVCPICQNPIKKTL